MINPALLGFAAGVVVGLLLALLWRKFFNILAFPNPDSTVTFDAQTMVAEVDCTAPTATGATLDSIFVKYYDHLGEAVSLDPVGENATEKPSFPFTIDHPGSMTSPDKIVVWLKYVYVGKKEHRIDY